MNRALGTLTRILPWMRGLNTSGLSQRNVIQVGPSHHEEADHVTLFKGRRTFETYA